MGTAAVPPLSEHRSDIPRLFTYFLEQCSERHPDLQRLWRPATHRPPPVRMSLMEELLAFDWPGNVRQLRNVVERLALASMGASRLKVPEEVHDELRPKWSGAPPPTDATVLMPSHPGGTPPKEHTRSR